MTAIIEASTPAKHKATDAETMALLAAEVGDYAETLYAVDIETDNSLGFGLDPRNGSITEVAVCIEPSTLERTLRYGFDPDRFDASVHHEGVVFAADNPREERRLLLGLDELMTALPSGLMLTWNGGHFDLPFLSDRAQRHDVDWGLAISPDERLVPKYDSLPGHTCGYHALWRHGSDGRVHRHLDVSPVFYPDPKRAQGLKPTARANGLNPIELDRTRLHEYSDAERSAYVMSDVVVTRALYLMRRLGLHTSSV